MQRQSVLSDEPSQRLATSNSQEEDKFSSPVERRKDLEIDVELIKKAEVKNNNNRSSTNKLRDKTLNGSFSGNNDSKLN